MVLWVGVAGRAWANTVYVAEVEVANPLSVNIYAVGIGDVGTEAGNYMIKYQTDPNTLVSGFCIDPHYSSDLFNPYLVQSIPKGSGFEAAAWILAQNYSPALAPAAQVAVWELTWDYQYGRAFSLTTGDFRLNTPDPVTSQLAMDVTAIYNAALDGIGPGSTFDSSRYVTLHSPVTAGATDYQDYVMPNPNPTPVPATAVLLGTGLLGLGLLSRRKKAGKGRQGREEEGALVSRLR